MEQPQVVDNTFYSDFTIADRFGLMAIQDTYNRSFKAYKGSIEYLTALAMALNHKIFAWHKVDDDKTKLYDKLWRETDMYILEGDKDGFKNFTREEVRYYLKVTD